MEIIDFISDKIIENKNANTTVVGISGPQGCGKTTICEKISEKLKKNGFKVESASIDDFYLTFDEQKKLALNTKNPFLKNRGYPGTHELQLMKKTLDNLRKPPFEIPRFSKALNNGRGDRLEKNKWIKVNEIIDFFLFEGWMLGFLPENDIRDPILSEVNELLKNYSVIWKKINLFFYLKPLEIEYTVDWRCEAEKEQKNGMKPDEVKKYIEKFLPAYDLWGSQLKSISSYKKFFEIVLDKNRNPVNIKCTN